MANGSNRAAANAIPVFVVDGPAGSGFTWGATQTVNLTGISQILIAANSNRKAITIANPTGSPAAYDLSGAPVTLAGGLPVPFQVTYEGSACPVGAITVIGTSGQTILYSEGT